MDPLLIALLFIILPPAFFCLKKNNNPKKIFGVYSQPGTLYYIKYLVFLSLLTYKKLKYILLGKAFFIKEENLEKLHAFSADEKAFDAVFFQGVTQDGFYFAAGTERRHQAKVNGLVYIKTPDHGLLLSEKLPNTELEADPASVLLENNFSAEGLTFTPVKPMKRWDVSFRGKMRSYGNLDKVVDVQLDGRWASDLPWFLFEVDLPSRVVAKAIALETWNKKLFEALKKSHQTHYEQMGYMQTTLKINDKEYKFKMDSFRDHSFGFRRDWTLMHRYIYHMFYLEDGTKASLGIISQPCTSSNMTFGYIVHPDKTLNPIEGSDLLLYQHAENGTPPLNLAFTFYANKTNYEVKIKYDVTAVHYVGNNIEAKMHERFLTCEINGVKGRGISEWHYNNVGKSQK